ncbi:MAG: YfdX family protein, partial [Chloroflexi bacterium]|nr:YfdX family protein [Chloroflexota bacterium]
MILDKIREVARKAESRTLEATQQREEGKLVHVATQVVEKLGAALAALREGQLEQAKALLAEARDLVAQLQESHEDVAALPFQVRIYQVVQVNDPEVAKDLLAQARKALDEGNVPLARILLNRLRNEIVVDTDLVPLKVLVHTLDLAQSMLDRGNVTGAISALAVLDTAIERVQTIIPRPLMEAFYLIEEIRKLDPKADQPVILELIKLVRQKVELSRVLGYLRDEEVIKSLLAQIEKVEQAAQEEKEQDQQLADLQEALDAAREKE